MKEYNKLEGSDYDKEKVEELAEAMNELVAITCRVDYLNELVDENKDLHKFVWRTLKGEFIANHMIKDDHLKNIMIHCLNRGGDIPKCIKAEARRRGFTVPTAPRTTAYIDAEYNEDEDWNGMSYEDLED